MGPSLEIRRKPYEKTRRHGGLDLILKFVVFRFRVFTKEHHPQNPKVGGRSVSIRIERRVSSVITLLVSPGSATVKFETFKVRG